MDDIETKVTDRLDEARSDMENGFRDLRKRVDEMDCDSLRREVQTLMMIGHQQMSHMRLMSLEIDNTHREILMVRKSIDKATDDLKEIADELGVPFDPTCDSPHVAARHVLSFLRNSGNDGDDTPRYIEIGAFVACVVLTACFVVWTLLMVSAWVR